MDKKFFITILLTYITLDIMKDIQVSNIWIINQLIELIVCFAVFLYLLLFGAFSLKKNFKSSLMG
jgi:hypothetical protein